MAVKRRSIRIQSSLLTQMNDQVQRDGYKANRRSKWVREAVYHLLQADPGLMTAGHGDDLDGKKDEQILLSGDADFHNTLADMVVIVRRTTPRYPDPESQLIRTAIRHRLKHAAEVSSSLKASSSAS